MKKNSKRSSLILSVVSIILCCTMLLGTTMAWFTDSVTSARNQIIAGNLDVELYNGTVEDANKVGNTTELFDAVDLWEPGVVVYEPLTVKNAGTLALKYSLTLDALNATEYEGKTLAEVIKVGTAPAGTDTTNRTAVVAAVTEWTNFSSFVRNGELKAEETDDLGYIVLYWEPTATDNDYNMNNGKTTELSIEVGVNLVATQLASESDSFGSDYDANATYPGADDGDDGEPETPPETPVDPPVDEPECVHVDADHNGKCDLCTEDYSCTGTVTTVNTDPAGHYDVCDTCTYKTETKAHTNTNGDDACDTCGYSPVDCDHAAQTNKAEQPATCTEVGYTAGDYCNDCEKYISGHEEIKALGHLEGTEWNYNDTNHWHICTREGCGVEIEASKAAHDYTDDYDYTEGEANHTAYCKCGKETTELHSYDKETDKCVCGAEETPVTPDCTHDNVEYTPNEDGTTHTSSCPDCDTYTPVTESHTVEEWTPSETTAGWEHTGTCTKCEASVTKHHNYDSGVAYDITCNTCGNIRDLEIKFEDLGIVDEGEVVANGEIITVKVTGTLTDTTAAGSYVIAPYLGSNSSTASITNGQYYSTKTTINATTGEFEKTHKFKIDYTNEDAVGADKLRIKNITGIETIESVEITITASGDNTNVDENGVITLNLEDMYFFNGISVAGGSLDTVTLNNDGTITADSIQNIGFLLPTSVDAGESITVYIKGSTTSTFNRVWLGSVSGNNGEAYLGDSISGEFEIVKVFKAELASNYITIKNGNGLAVTIEDIKIYYGDNTGYMPETGTVY